MAMGDPNRELLSCRDKWRKFPFFIYWYSCCLGLGLSKCSSAIYPPPKRGDSSEMRQRAKKKGGGGKVRAKERRNWKLVET